MGSEVAHQRSLESLSGTLPIGHIRLLYLHRRRTDGMLSCDLTCVPFDGNDCRGTPAYHALSYRWGGANADDPWILLDGYKHRIRRNLYSFLRYARKLKHRVFWIDALCINQQSMFERNHQVQYMDQIYKRANRVIIWLCDRRFPCSLLAQMAENQEFEAKDIGDAIRFDSHENVHDFARGTLIEQIRNVICRDAYRNDKRGIGFIKELLINQYWSRMWVIQEVRHAPPEALYIMLGDQLMSWRAF